MGPLVFRRCCLRNRLTSNAPVCYSRARVYYSDVRSLPLVERGARLSRFGGTATRSMLVERRKRAAYLRGESAFGTPGAVAHEQWAATSSVILFTRRVHGRVHPRKLAAVRVRNGVHRVHRFEELFLIRVSASRSRPRTRSGASPYSCSTCRTRARRARGLTGKPSACCWLGLSKVPTWQSD